MIILLLQDAVTVPSVQQISDLTEKFGYATASNIALMVVGLGMMVYLIYNVVTQLKAQTAAINDLLKGQAILLDRRNSERT